jgi:hypothetical protein
MDPGSMSGMTSRGVGSACGPRKQGTSRYQFCDDFFAADQLRKLARTLHLKLPPIPLGENE